MKSREEAKQALNDAISLYAGDIGPGRWVVPNLVGSGGRRCIGLTYIVEIAGDGPEPHPEFTQDDAPWKLWGGDAILSTAGLESFDGMTETYTDKYGDDIYADSAMIEVAD